MPAPLILAPWDAWSALEYFQDYYGCSVQPDEVAALRFQIAFLARSGPFGRAIEYGCGPTLMRAIAASRYVTELDMADRLGANLERVRLWASAHPRADDWTRFTEYVLACEGSEPTRREVAAREALTRRVIANVLSTNALQPEPLGSDRQASYDLLISGFCLDCLTQSRRVWHDCMRHVLGLLKPGGSFALMALRGCESYRVGTQWFPCANIQKGDLETALLACGANPERMELAECELPFHADQGYDGILMACGQTNA